MKHPLLFIIFACVFFSCKKEGDVADSVIKMNTEVSFVLNKTRDLETAKTWATKSISLIEGSNTKSSGVNRRIESWNVVVSPKTKSDSGQQDTLMYVFNFEDNAGFSIIAANSNLRPILAVTESGHYIAGKESGNDAFNDYMSKLTEFLSLRFDGPEYYWYDYVTEGEIINRSVGVRWGQNDIYGQYCSNGISGCVATAMAQIMAYHSRPSSFLTTEAMGTDFLNGASVSLSWPGIKQHVVSHFNTKTCNAYHNNIGALLKEIGLQVNMSYNSTSSSAYDSDVPAAFGYFGYTTSSPIPFDLNTAKNSIKSFGPIYMSGARRINSNDYIGHAWVVDGYKDYAYYYCRFERAEGTGNPPIITQQTLISEEHAFHINWGWDGDCNGYFDFGIYDIDGANSYDYSHNMSGRDYKFDVSIIVVYP